ncbi:MAG: hypothetical protein KBS47_04965 [Bacteroidales bacterium]|nr:hypothetical protein [Candidatus Equimonas enterica]
MFQCTMKAIYTNRALGHRRAITLYHVKETDVKPRHMMGRHIRTIGCRDVQRGAPEVQALPARRSSVLPRPLTSAAEADTYYIYEAP